MTGNEFFIGMAVGVVIGMVFYLAAKTEIRERRQDFESKTRLMNKQLDDDSRRIEELERELVIKKNVIKMLDDDRKKKEIIAKRLKK